MATIIKVIVLAIFFTVVFGQKYFNSKVIYWSLYVLMFVLVPALWAAMFWVSRKRAVSVLGETPNSDFFVGRVSTNVNDDLSRGRLCFCKDRISLVQKTAKGYEISWTVDNDEIKSVSFCTVAGIRKGFTFHLEDREVSFTSSFLYKNHYCLYKALGWKVTE